MAEQLENVKNENVEVKTFTQEEVDAIVQRESDKRVTQALQTSERKHEAKMKEAEKLAAMNEAEKQAYKYEQRIAELEQQIAAATLAENKAAGLIILNEKGLDASFIDLVLSEDADEMHARIKTLKGAFDGAVKREVEARLVGNVPVKAEEPGKMSREQFSKLSLREKQELYNRSPEEFRQLSN